MLQRLARASVVLIVSLVSALGGVAQANAQPADPIAAKSPEATFTITKTSTQSFAEAVGEAASKHPEIKSAVEALLPVWIARAKSGKNLGLDTAGIAGQMQEIREIQSQLSSAHDVRPQEGGSPSTTGPSPAPTSASSSRPTASGSTAGADNQGMALATAASGGDPTDPNSYPVRGTPGSGRTYWTGLTADVEQWSCGSGCVITDKILLTSTVNPGTLTDKISVKKLYSPNAGHFSNCVNLEFDSINRGTVTGVGLADNFCAASQTYYQGNGNHNYRGDVLTVAVAMQVNAISGPNNGSSWWDGGKTADAKCSSSTSSNVCTY